MFFGSVRAKNEARRGNRGAKTNVSTEQMLSMLM